MMFSFSCFSSDMKHFHLKLMEGKGANCCIKKNKLLNAGNELLNDNNHLHLILHV